MLAPPTTGSGLSVFVSAMLAPLTTVVPWVWTLLAGLLSLEAVSVAVAVIVVGPGPKARQRTCTSRTSVPLGPIVPRSQRTVVGFSSTQFAPAGVALTNVAPAGTATRSTVSSAAAVLLLLIWAS
jgi:hypothetical protein